MTRSLAIACLALLTLAAAPAAAPAAPGRVAFSVATSVPESNVDARGAGPAVALPDGGVVLLAADRAFKGVTAIQLRADGSIEPGFGSGGVARVAVPGGAFDALSCCAGPTAGCCSSAHARPRAGTSRRA